MCVGPLNIREIKMDTPDCECENEVIYPYPIKQNKNKGEVSYKAELNEKVDLILDLLVAIYTKKQREEK